MKNLPADTKMSAKVGSTQRGRRDTEVVFDAVEDDGDYGQSEYLQDPEIFYDVLPKPYRMISKILNAIYDQAWEIMAEWDACRLKEACRFRAPQYDCFEPIQEHVDATCLAGTPDGQYLVIGKCDGLAVVEAVNHMTVAQWNEDNLCLESVDVATLADQRYLVPTIDCKGLLRLFALADGVLFLLYTFYENQDKTIKKVVKCEATRNSDYIGIYTQSIDTAEKDAEQPAPITSCLEVYLLPKSGWIAELEAVLSKIDVEKQAALAQEEEDQAPAKGASDEEEGEECNKKLTGEEQKQILDEIIKKYQLSAKFTAVAAVLLKVNPPSKCVGISWSSPYQASKLVDGSGDVIGSCGSHLVSCRNLELRQSVFEIQNQEHMKYLEPDSATTCGLDEPLVPTFHFLMPGKLSPQGAEQPDLSGQPTLVAVWWSAQLHLLHYSLIKSVSGKDTELKPELVWPVSSPIVTSAVTSCTSRLVLGLCNNDIIVWDRYFGVPQRVLHLDVDLGIRKVSFTEQWLYRGELKRSTPGCLLVECNNGQVYSIPNDLPDAATPTHILDIQRDCEETTLLLRIDGVPELVALCRKDGRLFVQDVGHRLPVCEPVLPETHIINKPATPVAAITGINRLTFYVIAVLKEDAEGDATPEDATDDDDCVPCGTVFAAKLWSFPSLDPYQLEYRTAPVNVEMTLDKRVNDALQARISAQYQRKDRMQERWNEMKDRLAALQADRRSHAYVQTPPTCKKSEYGR